MLDNVIYLIISLFLGFSFAPVKYIDKDLQPYYNEVKEITDQYCRPDQYFHPARQTVYFSNLPDSDDGESHMIGLCEWTQYSYRIQIDKEFWKTANEDEKRQLIFHEMRHCQFKTDHVPNVLNYMYPLLRIFLTGDQAKQQFIDDLKKDCK